MPQLAGVRILAAWLADDTRGVNALLPDVPRDAADAAPSPIQAIVSSADTSWVRRGEIPRPDHLSLPLLAVAPAPKPATTDPALKVAAGAAASALANGLVTLAVQLVDHDNDLVKAGIAADYVLRAVRGSLLLLAAAPLAVRTRQGIQLVQLKDLQTVRFEDTHDVSVSGAVFSTWSTRETTPVAAPTAVPA